MPDPRYDPAVSRWPYPLHLRPYPLAEGAEPPTTLLDAVQMAVNTVAEQALTARAVFPTLTSPEGLACWPSWRPLETEADKAGQALRVAQLVVEPTPTRLWAEFTVSALAVERGDSQQLATLRDQVVTMAAAEDALVFAQALAAQGDPPKGNEERTVRVPLPGSDHPDEQRAQVLTRAVFAAAGELREAGHTGSLALVLAQNPPGQLAASRGADHLHISSLFAAYGRAADVLYAFERGIHTGNLCEATKAVSGLVGLVIDVGASGACINVGSNYEVAWLGHDGPDHRFGLCTTLALKIGNPDAMRFLALPPAPSGAL